MRSAGYVNTFLFGIYPYLCLAVLLIGSLIRFDREPYTWKSDSSQMLRKAQLRIGSNLFHYGVIVVILGHFAGFLAPTGPSIGRSIPSAISFLPWWWAA
jgi:nitrate reductase gamma subunit